MTVAENAVSLKLPTFWVSQPAIWFAQTEAQFGLRRITVDNTKYYYVLAALDQDTAPRLLDLIANPPDEGKYDTLKTRLLTTFGLSEREKASRLLHFRPLGDSKPSELMNEMLALLGDHLPCLFFEQLFLERLPDDIRIQLVDSKIENHRALAQRADALWTSRNSSFAFGANAVQRSHDKPYNKLKLTGAKPLFCYYHRAFGEAARQCRQPCTWPGNDKASR